MTDKWDEIFTKIDQTISEIRRYNYNTATIVLVLWGLGLPLSFLGTIIVLSLTVWQVN